MVHLHLPPGTERYVVRGAGDRLKVIDPEGRQRAELVAFDESDNADVGILGVRPNGGARALAAMVESADEGAKRVAASLRSRSLELVGARAVHLFAPDSAPGERETVIAGSAMSQNAHSRGRGHHEDILTESTSGQPLPSAKFVHYSPNSESPYVSTESG